MENILVVGAGAIGGYFGALLTRSGSDVAMMGRPGQDMSYLSAGYRIIDGPDEGTYRPHAWSEAEPTIPDLVVLAVKTYDTEAACDAIRPLVGEKSTVLVLQNGIERAQAVRDLLGLDNAIGGVVYLESVLDAPGEVRYLSGARRIVLGGPDPERLQRVSDLLGRSDINHDVPEDFRPAEWRKFALVSAANGLTSITKGRFGDILDNPYGRAVVWQILDEAATAGRADGVALDDSFADDGLAFLTELGPALRSSMLRDVERGRRTEVDALNGEVVRRADRAGTPAPTNRMVALVLDMHNRRIAAGEGR